MVQLPPDLVEQLDRRAEAAGVSRSQVIREAIRAYLQAGTDREARLAEIYRDAYARVPLETADDWGDLDSWHRGLERARATDPVDEGQW